MTNFFFCPICEVESPSFLPEGARINARCAHCKSLERDRFAWIFLKEKTDFFKNKKRLLHVAPEAALERKFSELLTSDYISCDINEEKAMLQVDITQMQFSNESFDTIYCGHVLEHVIEDSKAMAEFFRVLTHGGWALITVPIYSESTYEDFSITDPKERKKKFDQCDHVRKYGLDIIQRLERVGFEVELIHAQEILNADQLERMSLRKKDSVIFCKKPENTRPTNSLTSR